MDVSIIIPVFNVAPYIEECLKSVMRQTYEGEMECIIVDDCGTDNSISIAERLIADYKGNIIFKILRHDHNRGLSASRNTGTMAAGGGYLYYLDSDDEITEDCIEKLVSIATFIPEADMVVGNTMVHCINGEIYTLIRNFKQIVALTNKEVRRCFYDYRQMKFNVWNKLVRRDFIISNNILCCEGLILEDLLWTFNCLKYLSNAYFVSDVTYHYKYRAKSITTGSGRERLMYSYATVYKKILTHLTPNYEQEELKFYGKRIAYHYVEYNHDDSVYKDLIRLCWRLNQKYGTFSISLVLMVGYFLGLFKNGKRFLPFLFKLRHAF